MPDVMFNGCNGIIRDTVDVRTASDTFRERRVVQVLDFIDDTVRQDIVHRIETEQRSLAKYNSNNPLSALGQLGSAKHNDAESIFKQHYLIDGTTVFHKLPDMRYYYHTCFGDFVSRVVQTRVYPVDERRTINNSIIIYENQNDSLRWHTDGSIYNGKKVFTLLVYLYNRSSQELCYVEFDSGQKLCVTTPQCSCVVLEHFTLQHYVTPLRHGEKRIVWSMTFAEDPAFSSVISYAKDRIKNANYIGIGAFSSFENVMFAFFALCVLSSIAILVCKKLQRSSKPMRTRR
jgi:hypothetical protein